MSEFISAAEANRHFSRVIRDVREDGETFVVTAHGKPVAKIVPYDELAEHRDREIARKLLLERLRKQPVFHVEPWTRDELYDD